jgi:hypothetical protein
MAVNRPATTRNTEWFTFFGQRDVGVRAACGEDSAASAVSSVVNFRANHRGGCNAPFGRSRRRGFCLFVCRRTGFSADIDRQVTEAYADSLHAAI